MNIINVIRALIAYPRARREFAERVNRRRRESKARLDAALAGLREEPCEERVNEATRIISDRLGFEEQVREVARLAPVRFVAEAKAVA